MAEKGQSLSIPFGRAVRVGNYKLWRSRYSVGSGVGKRVLSCIHVSSLDGGWSVRIPETSQMYGAVTQGYATTDDAIREKFLGMLFTNIYNVCNISSEALHDGFSFLTEMMTFPYLLLSEEEMCRRMREQFNRLGGGDTKSFENHISMICGYRRQLYELIDKKIARFIESYEKQQSGHHPSEGLDEDAAAESAFDVLMNEEANHGRKPIL